MIALNEIASKLFRDRHLQDDRLYECYIAGQTGEPLDPIAADHLADCAACQVRYAELSSFVGGLRTEADADINRFYPAEAMQAMQAQIARRIEHIGHSARVISFPHHQPGAATGGHGWSTWSVAPRWLAAAAAAGLFIGVGVGSAGLGRLTQLSSGQSMFSRAVAARPAAQPAASPASVAEPASVPAPAAADVKDVDPSDEFLEQLEFALERPRTRELRALDELTPHVREISLNASIR